jgi:hypothetical protein
MESDVDHNAIGINLFGGLRSAAAYQHPADLGTGGLVDGGAPMCGRIGYAMSAFVLHSFSKSRANIAVNRG